MPELIDKKRTEAKVFLIARFFIDRPDREVELVKAVIHRCCEEIDKQPTIEAEPVRRGHWVLTRDEEYEYCHCSECGAAFHRNVAKHFKGCPICLCRFDRKRSPKEVQLDGVDDVVIHCKDCAFWESKRVSCEGLARCRTGESGYRLRFGYEFCSRAQKREEGDNDA